MKRQGVSGKFLASLGFVNEGSTVHEYGDVRLTQSGGILEIRHTEKENIGALFPDKKATKSVVIHDVLQPLVFLAHLHITLPEHTRTVLYKSEEFMDDLYNGVYPYFNNILPPYIDGHLSTLGTMYERVLSTGHTPGELFPKGYTPDDNVDSYGNNFLNYKTHNMFKTLDLFHIESVVSHERATIPVHGLSLEDVRLVELCTLILLDYFGFVMEREATRHRHRRTLFLQDNAGTMEAYLGRGALINILDNPFKVYDAILANTKGDEEGVLFVCTNQIGIQQILSKPLEDRTASYTEYRETRKKEKDLLRSK